MYTKNEEVTGTVQIWAVPRQSWALPDSPPFTYQIGRSYYVGEVKVSEHKVTLQVPEGINLFLAAMDTLESAKQDAFKEYQNKAKAIDEQINAMRLLAGPSSFVDAAECRHHVSVFEHCLHCEAGDDWHGSDSSPS